MLESQRTRQTVIGLLLLCFLLYFWELGRIPFYNYEESKEALIVWEMVNGGGWILPLRNGTELPLKPPLFHWIGATLSLLSGTVNEFTVRAPSAFAATAAVLLTYFFGKAFWSWRVGLFAALILATSPEWARWAINARSDMLLVFFLTLAMMSFFRVWQERATQRRTIYLFYASVGLATLAKGPLGLLLPGLVVLAFLAERRELHFIRRMKIVGGPLLALLIAASWYLLAMGQGGGEVFTRQILDENVFRFFDSDQGGPSREHAFWYYLPTLFAGMLPWSLFFPAMISVLYRSYGQHEDAKRRYLVIWCVVEFLFFTLASGKRSNYILPLYPALAVLLGSWWQELMESSLAFSPVVKRLTRGSMLLLGYGFALIVIVLIAHSAGLDLAHMVSPFLHPRDQANLPLVAAGLQSHFSIVLVWLALLAFAVGWYFWGFKREQWMWVFAALTVLLSSSLYFTNALFHPILANERTYRPFMLGTRSTVKDAPLYFYKDAYDYGAIFYAGRHIPLYTDELADLADFADLTGKDNVSSPLYLFMREADWNGLATPESLRLEYLVKSEGKGPDKKHRLVLVALLPAKNGTQPSSSEAAGPETQTLESAESQVLSPQFSDGPAELGAEESEQGQEQPVEEAESSAPDA